MAEAVVTVIPMRQGRASDDESVAAENPDGLMLTQIFRRYQPAEAIGMNLVAPRSEIAPGCKLEPRDVVKGYDHWELREKYDLSITPETFRLLRDKYPERRHFGYDRITVPLAKPEKAVSSGAV